jgi:hypothetical protein
MGSMKRQKTADMLQKLSKEKLINTLTSDDTAKIDRDINNRMKDVEMDFKQRHVRSQMDATKIFLTF